MKNESAHMKNANVSVVAFGVRTLCTHLPHAHQLALLAYHTTIECADHNVRQVDGNGCCLFIEHLLSPAATTYSRFLCRIKHNNAS